MLKSDGAKFGHRTRPLIGFIATEAEAHSADANQGALIVSNTPCAARPLLHYVKISFWPITWYWFLMHLTRHDVLSMPLSLQETRTTSMEPLGYVNCMRQVNSVETK